MAEGAEAFRALGRKLGRSDRVRSGSTGLGRVWRRGHRLADAGISRYGGLLRGLALPAGGLRW